MMHVFRGFVYVLGEQFPEQFLHHGLRLSFLCSCRTELSLPCRPVISSPEHESSVLVI